MSKIDDGGPAFPRPASEFTKSGTCPDGNDPIDAQAGMSLRDYFAAKAMHAFLADFGLREAVAAVTDGPESQMLRLAECAYQHADAMIAVRQKARP